MGDGAELLVGTHKGLFVLRGERGGPMEVTARRFEGVDVEYAIRDPRTGTCHASVTSGHFGPRVWHASDPTGEWEQSDGPAFPEDAGATVKRIWVIHPGEEDGVMWAGVAPAALFRSDDGGRTWSLNRGLWDDPTRARWEGGAGGLCLHSIAPWPGDPARLSIAISAVGVWHSDDGGETWRRRVEGIVPRYLPEEARADTMDHCVHNLRRVPTRPERMFLQFHNGVYRSDDAGETWLDIGGEARGLPSDFGFPMVVDPHRTDRAFVIPLVADLDRTPPEGKLRVYETADAGESWRALSDGLPQEDAWHTVLRQAFAHDGGEPLGLYFGAESGEVYGSADGGETWRTVIEHLPPILSVRVSG
ncbi:MAG: exo-alpha-sialidase [Actinobacteria bacterium]|nr:exo-alpha-sialidase [Actinomycetota bacterium]